MINKIPSQIKDILKSLEKADFEAYIVGGCVRDLIMGKEPKDWDVTTNAKPEEVLKVFPDGKYENNFGTVIVPQKYLVDLPIISSDIKIGKETKEKAIEIAKKYLSKIKCQAHRIKHSENVVRNVLLIAKEYKKINQDVMEIAAYFHDTGRSKYEDGKHIDESVDILKKELSSILSKADLAKLIAIIQHQHSQPSDSLEQLILKEADMIDGIDVERVEIVKKIKLKIHFDWIKNDFASGKMYKNFITPKGKELFSEAVAKFNQVHSDIAILPSVGINNQNIEITTFRIESKYSDKRHPDEVKFAKTLEEDLSRRDFTINAMAIGRETQNVERGTKDIKKITAIRDTGYAIYDLFGGQEDLKKKIIRAVGKAEERFDEDALRMMRAIRFASTLNFSVEEKTLEAIKKNAKNLKFISEERIKDELVKIILSDRPSEGIDMLHQADLLNYIIPELERGVGMKQNLHHIYTIYQHSILSLKFCPSRKLEVRLAALFHDIAKPQTKRGEGPDATFYNHDHVGARVAEKILRRLKFSNDVVEKVRLLIDNHMFYYNPDEVGESSVRRLVQKAGLQNMKDLIDLRISDRLGSGVPKAKPYKLRHLEYLIEKVSSDAVSVKMLKINGNDLMKELGMKPGPKIGAILDVMLSEVIEDASKNEKEYLLSRAKELDKEDLAKLRTMAKKKIEEKKEEEDQAIKNKYWVK